MGSPEPASLAWLVRGSWFSISASLHSLDPTHSGSLSTVIPPTGRSREFYLSITSLRLAISVIRVLTDHAREKLLYLRKQKSFIT